MSIGAVHILRQLKSGVPGPPLPPNILILISKFWNILILISKFWKILILISKFLKILILSKYCIDKKLTYQTLL